MYVKLLIQRDAWPVRVSDRLLGRGARSLLLAL